MRGLWLLLCFAGMVVANDESDYKNNVLILKDGRTIAIRGDMEVIGDEVQFMYADGKLMTLPLGKVDLDATREKQAELAEKAAKEAKKVRAGGDDTYDRIREYQTQNPPKDSQNNTQPPPPRVFEKKETQRKILDFDSSTLETLDQEKVQRYTEQVLDHFKTLSSGKKWLGGSLLGLLILFSLISFGLRLYLIWISRHQSMLWAFFLAAATFAPIGYSFFASVIPDESVLTMLVGLFFASLQLIEPFLYATFVLIHCIGKRLLFLFLLFSPILIVIALVAALFFFDFPMPQL